MKHVIIGTAGHVDHGKTALIRALTGIDTDRLEEEKRRGITIELGFAHLDFEDGTQAGIVDVPGHERFIRNMLAGAGGIDLAMLVVAADEGIMPQTAEHMAILSLLGIRTGLVVVTKTDLVEDEWLEIVLEDIAAFVKDTFLEGQPVLPVSARTGYGLDGLKAHLHALVRSVEEKNANTPFRLPVDRVFPVDGFGTVVTGTLIDGTVRVGDAAELLPSGITATVRSLQVHGSGAELAGAGQRVAMSLAGVKKSDVRRGDVVAKPGTVRCTSMLDVRLDMLRDTKRTIKNASLLHLYHGARVVLAKAILLDCEELLPGEHCYAQLRLTEPLPSRMGDRFVVRFYSPLETIGGGVILDPSAPKRRRNNPAAIEALRIREQGSAGQRILHAFVKSGFLPGAARLQAELDMDASELASELAALTGSGEVLELLPGRYLPAEALARYADDCTHILAGHHERFPMQAGLHLSELRQKLFGAVEVAAGNAVLARLAENGVLRLISGGSAALLDFEIRLTKRQQNLRELFLRTYQDAGYEAPPTDEVLALAEPGDRKDAKPVMESLLSEGALVKLTPQLYLSRAAYDKALGAASEHFMQSDTLTMPQFRDMLGTSRKYALAFLDYLDSNGVTKKTGDDRTLFKGFSALDRL